MKKIELYVFVLLSGLLASPGFCATQENPPLSLTDCYTLALRQSESIAIDAQRIREAEARFLQAFGIIVPNISFSHAEVRQDSVSSGDRSYEQKFVFTQQLFSGFKEFAAISASGYEKKQRKSEKLRAEQLLFVDVADAFYLLREEREELAVLEATKKALLERVTELKNRAELGKSRQSEVVSTQTGLFTLEDQLKATESAEIIARELLEFLIGRPAGEIVEPAAEYTLKDEAVYLAKVSSRPDVQAQEYAWQAAKKNVAIAKSGFWPTISAEGDYFTHRSSAPLDSKWQVLAAVNIPIFEGTTVFGQVKQANAIARENELLSQLAGRSAAQDIRNAYVNASYAFSRAGVLEQALKSAELNYKLQQDDYKLNVVNNLDVLTALKSLQDVRGTYTHMLYEGRRFYWQLAVAAGEIDPENYR
jgi:outer membrane protein